MTRFVLFQMSLLVYIMESALACLELMEQVLHSLFNFFIFVGHCIIILKHSGKTTIFKMLTGDESVSSGESYISNKSLQLDRKSFLSQIGYCPQFDGIIGALTASQMLHLFARLRGIEEAHVTTEVDKWLERMGTNCTNLFLIQ